MKYKRKATKGRNGRVLVIGGSKNYVGAPALAALAALRTGVDIVTVCAPEKVAWAINTYSPDMITKKFVGDELNLSHVRDIITIAQQNDVILIGPGLGEKKDFVLKILRDLDKPFVIDADAIKVLTFDVLQNSIVTPHKKEFEIIYNNSIKKPIYEDGDIKTNIKNVQNVLNNTIVLLKGREDYIFSKNKLQTSKTGNNSMTVGGTGDILAGLCAGYLAQSKNAFESAKNAAYINGKCGEYMYKQRGYGYTAYDMVNELWRFTK